MRWSGTRSRGFVALVIALVVAAPVGPVAAASPPYLAENLRPGEGSEPAEFVGSSEMVYFTAGDPEHGREVWRTDGTPEGTSLVADIHPGPEGSEPFGLVEYQDGILFAASDDQGPAIWRASGELVGATVVARTTIDAKWDSAPPPIVAGDRIFVTGDTTSGLRLMQVDQATGALRSVGDIGERVHSVRHWFDVEGTLFFTIDRAHQARTELWATDGTDAGTRSLGRIGTHGEELTDYWPIEWMGDFTALGSTLFFIRAWASGVDCETDGGGDLWMSDGTRRGTRRAGEALGRIGRCIADVTRVGDRAYFTSYRRDPGSRVELWVTDGTRAGTSVIASYRRDRPDQLTAFGDELLFVAGEGDQSVLWATDGTTTGTRVVGAFRTHRDAGIATAAGERAYMLRRDQLWVTDGTAEGTALVPDLETHDLEEWQLRQSARLGSAIVLAVDDGTTGTEPWTSDGTADGTRMLRDIDPTDLGSDPVGLTPTGASLFFGAHGDTWRPEIPRLWALEPGYRINDSFAGPVNREAVDPRGLVVLGRQVLFAADQMGGRHGVELWSVTDEGSRARMVRDIRRGQRGSNPSDLVVMGRRVYFAATSRTGRDLWATDGSRDGTAMIADLAAGRVGAPQDLVVAADRVFFTSGDEANGRELWTSDGTADGTRPVADIRAGESGSDITGLTALGDRVYFSADDGLHGAELWASDGSSDGTRLVRDLDVESGSRPSDLTSVGDRLYFTAVDQGSTTGTRLWTTDGTASGTVVVPPAPGCEATGMHDPSDLTDDHGTLYFVATCGDGRELYRTGDAPGDPAILVADVRPDGDADPDILASVYGRLYFSADDGIHGRELWSTDGTPEGTLLAGDINASGSSDPADLVAFRRDVYFTADDGVHGREPWWISP